MNSRTLALAALFIAAVIYGVTYTIAKDVMPNYIQPYGFILIRVGGATIVYWLLGLFVQSQKIDKSDYLKLVQAAFFGVGLNMLTFFKGLNLTTPISASVMMVTTPILVLIFSSIILKERIRKTRVLGIFIGLLGAIVLIVYGNTSHATAPQPILGNFLVFINAASYAVYLVLVKNLMEKYHPLVFAKWMYLIGFFFILPFGFSEVLHVSWQHIPTSIYLKIGFVILFTTCVNYVFNLYALSKLKPTTVSVFIYLQPVIATIYALFSGSDHLNTIKIVASLGIFLGVFLVTKQPSKNK